MDLNYFNRKEDSVEYDVRKKAFKGYAKGKTGFLEQMKRLRGVFR